MPDIARSGSKIMMQTGMAVCAKVEHSGKWRQYCTDTTSHAATTKSTKHDTTYAMMLVSDRSDAK
jgi:hypothetical protein